MKRIVVITIILLASYIILHAQEEVGFYRHELRAALGEASTTSYFRFEEKRFTNISVSYFYRPVNFFWAGMNFVNYFGEKTYYILREYDLDGNHRDFSESKMKYCAFIAPEIRLSCVNRRAVIVYGGLSAGIGIENGFDNQRQKYPYIFRSVHFTFFGISGNLGPNDNIILGFELGFGFKGVVSAHAGYRF